MRTVAVLPHPDDEVFLAGSLRAWGAQIVCVTRGEAGVDHVDGLCGEALGDKRWRELEASCAALGLPAPIGLGLPDGGVRADEVAARVMIHVEHSDRVVTLGRDGVYGHLDHLAVTEGVLNVVDVAHLAVFPPGLFRPLWRGLRRAGFRGVRPGMRPEDFGSDRFDVEVPSPVELRQRAAACHASQLRDGVFLRPGLLEGLGAVDRYEVVR